MIMCTCLNISLKDQLQPPTWQLLSQYKELPMGFEQMRPWLLALNLTLQKAAELGYRSDLGVDYYLLSKAMGVKPIINLETLDLQLGVLSGDSALEQDLTLRLTLEQLPDMSSYIGEVREAWQQGDVESIYHSIEQPKRDYPELSEQFYRQVTRRNLHMARQIADFLQDKEDYLVVIGGGHLGGDEGVLALLKKQGVEAVQQPKLGRSMLY